MDQIILVFYFYYFSFNRFCGWIDAELSARGVAEATQAGKVQYFSACFLVSTLINLLFSGSVSEGEWIRVRHRLYERSQTRHQDSQQRPRCSRLALDTSRAVLRLCYFLF